MFSLIITIISIALVAALAVATIYYGGSAFTQGTAKANASALVSAAQQVQGADTLFQNDNGGNHADDVQALVTGSYLQSEPTLPASVTAFGIADGLVTATVTGDSVCEAIVKSAGGTEIGAARTTTRAYDCYGTAGAYTFEFGTAPAVVTP